MCEHARAEDVVEAGPQQVAQGSPKKNNIFCDIRMAKRLHRKRVEVGGFWKGGRKG